MTALSRAALKNLWIEKFQPTSGNFADLFDSMTSYEAFLEVLGSRVSAGATGLMRAVSPTSVSFQVIGTVGSAFLSAATTTALALASVGAGTFGQIVFSAATTAAAQAQLGGNTVGIQLLGCTTTAQATSILSTTPTTPVPCGTLMPYAGATASPPTGWMNANGQAVSRVTYADLLTAISYVYGSGDGTTTFNVPDIRGRTVFGHDSMASTTAGRITTAVAGFDGAALGAVGGTQSVTLATTDIPAHTHTQGIAAAGGAAALGACGASLLTTTGSTGGGGAHRNVPPALILNWIIKHTTT